MMNVLAVSVGIAEQLCIMTCTRNIQYMYSIPVFNFNPSFVTSHTFLFFLCGNPNGELRV